LILHTFIKFFIYYILLIFNINLYLYPNNISFIFNQYSLYFYLLSFFYYILYFLPIIIIYNYLYKLLFIKSLLSFFLLFLHPSFYTSLPYSYSILYYSYDYLNNFYSIYSLSSSSPIYYLLYSIFYHSIFSYSSQILNSYSLVSLENFYY
jgi:hypothetical protein